MRMSGVVAACVVACACSGEPRIPEWCTGGLEWHAVHLLDERARHLHLEELWRVGGMDGEEVFARPTRASISGSGRVAVPDMTTSAVLVVEPDGTWRGSIVREGEGPGEVRWPVDVEWLGEDRLAVFDLFRGAVLSISDSGDLLEQSWRLDPSLYARIAASGSLPGADLMPDGTLVLEFPWEPRPSGPPGTVAVVAHLRSDGSVDTIQIQPVTVMNEGPFRDWPVPGAPRPLYAAGATGPLFRAGMVGDYRIIAVSHIAVDSAVICRVVPPVPYTSAERGDSDQPRQLAEMLRRAPRPQVPASIGSIVPGEGGRLLVLRNRPDPAAPHRPIEGGEYDVISESGALIGTVQVPERVYLVGEGGGQLYGFERGEYDEVALVAYRIVETTSW